VAAGFTGCSTAEIFAFGPACCCLFAVVAEGAVFRGFAATEPPGLFASRVPVVAVAGFCATLVFGAVGVPGFCTAIPVAAGFWLAAPAFVFEADAAWVVFDPVEAPGVLALG